MVMAVKNVISSSVLGDTKRLREAFVSAKPFKHLCVDNFLGSEMAEALLSEFPKFDEQKAKNEHGKVGGKAVHTDIRSIGPAYKGLFDYISSQEFLTVMSDMTGISDLHHDPEMYGGGTHENLHGQELDPHVDFNYSQDRQMHRRINALIYLNKEWSPDWGGAIELHSNPRDTKTNEIQEFNCVFNRCVLFETNEYSWHGFKRIELPEHKRHLSRKCVSIYLYSRERPAEEVVPEHATFYVQRPLPKHLSVGHTLSADDLGELDSLLQRRDSWLAYYQCMELAKQAEIDRLNYSLVETRTRLKARMKQLEDLVSQQNSEVELRGQLLDKKRAQLVEEQTRVLDLQQQVESLKSKIQIP